MPQPQSTQPTTASTPLVKKLVAKVVELSKGQYRSQEARALFETFVLRLSAILDEKQLAGMSNIWLQGDTVFFQLPDGTPELVLPGKRNPYGSVTGGNITEGGWGTPTDDKLECPACNGDNFRYVPGFAEAAENRCLDCGYHEYFIY